MVLTVGCDRFKRRTRPIGVRAPDCRYHSRAPGSERWCRRRPDLGNARSGNYSCTAVQTGHQSVQTVGNWRAESAVLTARPLPLSVDGPRQINHLQTDVSGACNTPGSQTAPPCVASAA